MTGSRHIAAPLVMMALGLPFALGGCFLLHGDDADAGSRRDGGATDGSGAFDGGSCPWIGTTRLCTPHCDESCGDAYGDLAVCGMYLHVCIFRDERGQEQCSEDPDDGYMRRFCLGGHVCMLTEREHACVDMEVCRWARDRPEPEYASAVCRYSDGTEVVDGPPEAECAPGALPAMPFCGGPCGDTCPVVSDSPISPPGCYGMSEIRAFGVCSPDGNPPCEATNASRILNSCAIDIALINGGDPSAECACMRLAREPGGPLLDWGQPVATQSCLAYRDLYPDQVSCLDADWREL